MFSSASALRVISAFLVLLLFVVFQACTAPDRLPPPVIDYTRPLGPGEKALVRISRTEYPDFEKGLRDRAALLIAVERSIEYMQKPSSHTHFPVEGISHRRTMKSLMAFRDLLKSAPSTQDLARRIKRDFDVYRSTGCDQRGTVLFTGYCEPIIRASLKQTSRFSYPLYRLPEDLVKDKKGAILGRRTSSGKLVPYYTRQEIDEGGVLKGKGLEFAWVEHPIDSFFIHVQGSATLKLMDGTSLKIGYAGKNGREYRSIGQALVKDGKIEASRVSMDSIRRYFKHHPKELLSYLYQNESYVFFTEKPGGPYGSINVEVTPYHTIATDKTVFPRAALTFLDTSLPARQDRGRIAIEPYVGFALDQDTGGAIRSAGRVDLFLGTGREAEMLAGRTRCEGKLYYLFVR